MVMTDLREYETDVSEDETTWLGELVIFSVNQTLVLHTDIARKMTEGGLQAYIPAEPKDENVWRRIYTDGVRVKVKTPTDDDPEASQRVMLRTLDHRSGRIVKQVVVETVDVKGRRLGYEPVLEVTFDAADPDSVGVKEIGGWHPEAATLVEQLRVSYLAERGRIDENKVRDIVRQVLDAAHGTVVRPGGGVYFVKADRHRTVVALEAMGAVIPNCIIHAIPLIDSEKQRANIKAAFEMESQVQLDRLLIEMRDLVKAKTEITESKAAAFAKESQKAKAKVREYKALLNDGLDGVDSKIEIFDLVFAQLLNQVKA